MRKLRTDGDPILKTKCQEVTAFDDNLYQLAMDMRKIMQENKGVGLAAPQVGETLRVIIVQKQKRKGTFVVINPKISYCSEHTTVLTEGCLSYPGKSVPISRPNSVEVHGKSLLGRDVYIKATGIEARIFCHEIDHLDGVCKVGGGK